MSQISFNRSLPCSDLRNRPCLLFISALEVTSWGAAETLWQQTALTAHQYNVDVWASVKHWTTDPEPIKQLERAGIQVLRRNNMPTSAHMNWVSKADDSIFERIHPDLVVINQPDNYQGVTWMNACRNHKLSYVVITHYASESEWPEDAIVDDLAEGFSSAARAFFVSYGSWHLTERQIGKRLTNAEIVRCPFNVNYDIVPAWPESGEGLRLACVARLDPEDKGQDIIFEVMASTKWQERDLSISLFGDGPFRKCLERQATFWGTNRVILQGYTEDVQGIWAEHHGLILPSRSEGLPASIVEAMLCGRVCIVTNVGGNKELLEDGVTGFIAPYPRADVLDIALERMWMRRSQLQDIGFSASGHVRRIIPRDPPDVFYNRLVQLL